jgi:hypothetical protein
MAPAINRDDNQGLDAFTALATEQPEILVNDPAADFAPFSFASFASFRGYLSARRFSWMNFT